MASSLRPSLAYLQLCAPRASRVSVPISRTCPLFQYPSSRPFTRSTLSLAKKHPRPATTSRKPAPTPPSKPSARPPQTPTIIKPPSVPYRSFAEELALRPTPTILYQAPSHRVYIIGSYAFGTFCLAYAGYNFYAHYLHPPDGLAFWVPVAFGAVSIGMAGLGTWLFMGPSRLIAQVSAVPRRLGSGSGSSSGARAISSSSAAGNGSAGSVLDLHIEIKRPVRIPFISKARILVASPSDLSIYPRLSPPPELVIPPAEIRRQEEAQREVERTKIMSAPFRHMSYFIWRMLQALGKVWTREGFSKVKIEGKSGVWKIDRDGGWALSEGRGIDRLIRVRSM